MARQRFGPDVHLDSYQDPGRIHDLGERNSSRRCLTDGLVVEDGTRHRFGQPWSGEQQLAIGAAVFFRAVHTMRLEPFAASPSGFIHGEDPFARRHQRACSGLELFCDAGLCHGQ
jgi:hypothetical protein